MVRIKSEWILKESEDKRVKLIAQKTSKKDELSEENSEESKWSKDICEMDSEKQRNE